MKIVFQTPEAHLIAAGVPVTVKGERIGEIVKVDGDKVTAEVDYIGPEEMIVGVSLSSQAYKVVE